MSIDDHSTHYKTYPALAAYIDRIGAVQVNYRRFMVREYSGYYYHEKVLITINRDGTVRVSSEAYAPTDEEANAIHNESPNYMWPRAVPASVASAESEIEKLILASHWDWDAKNLFLFPDVKDRGNILMAQYRADKRDGGKVYLPFIYLENGYWTCMEPEDRLPFWKPAANRQLAKVMVHEGAKAARAMDDLVNKAGADWDFKRAEHPWYKTLCGYEHWGMIGGALSPHRADFGELHARQLQEVVYVCDNDAMGMDVLQSFSRLYGHKLVGVKFHGQFPDAWDMADELPRHPIDDISNLKMFMKPATWAVEQIEREPGQMGRPQYRLTKDFKKEWRYTVEPELYVHKDRPDRPLNAKNFNALVKPFARPVEDVAKLVQHIENLQARQLKYDPAKPPGMFQAGGFECLNTHMPSAIAAVKGDPAPWLDFIGHLILHESDRKDLLRWCATLVAAPEEHMSWGILLISEVQGVGKTTLGQKILAPLVGFGNASFPTESQIMGSRFNSWAAHKRLVVIEEVYSGADTNKMYNELKTYFTSEEIEVERKFLESYKIDNYVHIFANSNSRNAIKIQTADRRWLVPEVSEDTRPFDYWKQLNNWLFKQDGLGIIKHWAGEFLKTNSRVYKGEHAPDNSYKHDIIKENFSRGQSVAYSAIAGLKASCEPDSVDKDDKPHKMRGKTWMMMDFHLTQIVRDKLYDGRSNDRMERLMTLTKVLKEIKGVHIAPNKLMFNGIEGRPISNDKAIANLDAVALRRLCLPEDKNKEPEVVLINAEYFNYV